MELTSWKCGARARPVAIGQHGVVNALGNRIPAFASPGNFFAIFHYCFPFVDKERSPETLIELNLGL